MEAAFGGGENDGGVIEKEEVLLHPAGEFGEGGHFLFGPAVFFGAAFHFLVAGFFDFFRDQVPFVDDDDAGFAGLDDFAANLFVLPKDARFGVENKDDDVGAGDGILRAFDAEEFDGVIDAAFLADASRIDEQVTLANAFGFDFEGNVDGVASGAGNGADDDAFGFGEGVDDGRFANVGAANDGEFHRVTVIAFIAFPFRNELESGLHELGNAAAVNRAHGKNGVDAEAGKIGSGRFRAISINFVNGEENRFAGDAEAAGDFLVERGEAFLDVDDEDDDVGGFDGEFDLFDGGGGDDVGGFFAADEADATGIHEGEAAAVPFGFGGDAIAGDARFVMNDGDAAADNPVKKGGFSDVRATDNGD